MKEFDKLRNLDIKNKEKYKKIFINVIKEIKDNSFNLALGERLEGDYYIVTEEGRMDSIFVHIVPKEAYNLFKEMQTNVVNQFLGFSVLVREKNGKPLRVSCFGISCSDLGKSLSELK